MDHNFDNHPYLSFKSLNPLGFVSTTAESRKVETPAAGDLNGLL